jgi:hypothetical protein
MLLSSVLLGCAWFVLVNALLSASVALIVHARPAILQQPGPAGLLLLRLLPGAASLGFVLLLFLPAHWRWEIADADERFGVVLCIVAAAALPLVIRSIVRGAWALWQSRRLRREARAAAVAHADRVLDVPGFPDISLAGLFRTTILVGVPVRSALTAGELAAAIAHESAHRHAWDNAKRLAMFCAPDFLAGTATAARIEEAWRAESEYAADAAAAASDAARAADLASALIKVARLLEASPSKTLFPLWSLFCERDLLERRVRVLVAHDAGRRPAGSRLLGMILGAAMVAPAVAWFAALPHDLYRVSEALVRFLP